MTRRAFILPVVLVLIGLLALIMAGFMFFVRAEVAGAQAERDEQQAWLVAQSGLDELTYALRDTQDDPTVWFDNPDQFRHVLVWSPAFTREEDPVRKMGSREEILEDPVRAEAWRYSIVAQAHDGLPDTMRYGITPESSKLNLNARHDGWEAEIERLVTPILIDLQLENAPDLVACLLDWLDEDEEPRPGGAEDDYYTNLDIPYYTKNGKLDTLEELLLVKGWTAAVLYGEDVNRNGLLDLNEDDADASFPLYDNADGELNYGVAPFVTVWSREPNTGQQQGGGGQQEEEQGDQGQYIDGRINVNTAPFRVLTAIEGMTVEMAESIVALREEVEVDARQTTEWIVTAGAVDAVTYNEIKDRLTTQSHQFHVEILAYGDHTRLLRRYEWIIEMRGALVQVVYHRDLTGLGQAWPIDDDTFVISGQ